MATNSSQTTVFGAKFSPLVGEPRMGLVPIPNITITTDTLTTAGGERDLTAAEILGGFLLLNCDDAQNANLPDAEDLIAAIPGVNSVNANQNQYAGFVFYIRNTGDATLTIVAGAGGTVSGTATIATTYTKAFLMVITDATQGAATYTCYSLGTSVF